MPLAQDIVAISFDADGTLVDFRAVMRRSLAIALEALERSFSQAAGQLTVDDLVALRNAVAGEPWALARTHEEVRQESFFRAIASMGGTGRSSRDLAAQITALYMHHRFRDIVVYPDVCPALLKLGARYTLGVISNGNSYPDRCGLPDVFRFVVLSQDHHVRKPDPELFRIGLRAADCAPARMLHVGDSLTEDVGGAHAAGMPCAWLNRTGAPSSSEIKPEFEISSLSELSELL